MTESISSRDADRPVAAPLAASDLSDEAVIIVIRAWKEDHPEAPFRATITVQVADLGPTRHVVGSVDDLCLAVRESLAQLEART